MLRVPLTITAEELALEIIRRNARWLEEFELLKRIMAAGTFHHATYRDIGKCWEGLYIYTRHPNGCRGFTMSACIVKDSPYMEEGYALVRGSGVSVGSYGEG